MWKRLAIVMVVALTGAVAASAQTPPQGAGQGPARPPSASTATQQPARPDTMTAGEETRPATTTFMGDTGLWFVPTGEILPARKWSFSLYRTNFDYNQGFTDVSNWPVTFGVGLGDRAEIFGAFTAVRRIDRDVRPIFLPSQPEGGGVTNDYPFVRQGWSDNQIGDLWLGAKINLTSEYRQKPAAFAIRGMVKIPTAKDTDEGVGTGKPDFTLDAIVSKEVNQRVEVAGYGGFIVRGNPSDAELSNGIRWGVGAGFPSRKPLRLTTEFHGEKYVDDSVTMNRHLVGEDGSVAGTTTPINSPATLSFGLTWQHPKGFFLGGGM